MILKLAYLVNRLVDSLLKKYEMDTQDSGINIVTIWYLLWSL